MTEKHPMQPVLVDREGIVRFKANAIVYDLLEIARKHGFGLNEIGIRRYEQDDIDQFWQLTGYPVHGYESLSIVSDESVQRAKELARTVRSKKNTRDAQSIHDDLRAFAKRRVPALSRAAAEGYDVAAGVLDTIAAGIGDPFGATVKNTDILRDGSAILADLSWTEREAPSDGALELRQKVDEYVRQYRRGTSMPECVHVDVSRVMRIEAASLREKFTGVVVTIQTDVVPERRIVIIRAESRR